MDREKERDPQTYTVIGAAMEVHRVLGQGFLEIVYQKALGLELERRGIPYRDEVKLPIHYKGMTLPCFYEADFICFEEVLVETKALGRLTDIERAQVLNYLKATGLTRALLINFGTSRLDYERIVLNYSGPSSASSATSADKTVGGL